MITTNISWISIWKNFFIEKFFSTSYSEICIFSENKYKEQEKFYDKLLFVYSDERKSS